MRVVLKPAKKTVRSAEITVFEPAAGYVCPFRRPGRFGMGRQTGGNPFSGKIVLHKLHAMVKSVASGRSPVGRRQTFSFANTGKQFVFINTHVQISAVGQKGCCRVAVFSAAVRVFPDVFDFRVPAQTADEFGRRSGSAVRQNVNIAVIALSGGKIRFRKFGAFVTFRILRMQPVEKGAIIFLLLQDFCLRCGSHFLSAKVARRQN